MSTNFPTAKDTTGASGTLPVEPSGTPLSTNHITAHQNESDAIIAIETKVGTDSSTDPTSLDYLVKNSSSVNPGHKHSMAAGISDVDAPTPSDGDVLIFSGSESKWKNGSTSAPDASTTVKGVAKMSVAPVSSTSPIALGANDASGVMSLISSQSGTAISSSNKVIDAATIPAGSVSMFAASSPPTGWLVCNGAAVSRTTYATLYAAIGTTWGSGDGSTTFNVPDLRGRAPIGVGTGTGGGASGNGAPTGGSSLTARSLADWVGEETHTLSQTEMPSHTHSQTYGGGSTSIATSGNQTVLSGTGTTGSTGGGGAHNNIQPVIAINFIIKT